MRQAPLTGWLLEWDRLKHVCSSSVTYWSCLFCGLIKLMWQIKWCFCLCSLTGDKTDPTNKKETNRKYFNEGKNSYFVYFFSSLITGNATTFWDFLYILRIHGNKNSTLCLDKNFAAYGTAMTWFAKVKTFLHLLLQQYFPIVQYFWKMI